jgi:hypothetical protein
MAQRIAHKTGQEAGLFSDRWLVNILLLLLPDTGKL